MLTSLLALQLAAPSQVPQAFDSFRERWETTAKGLGASCFAVVVVKDGQVIHRQTWGFRDVNQSVPVTPSSKFYIASITKTYTALAISKLEEQGKIKGTDLVTKYLPWFKLAKNPMVRPITIDDLLSHSPGIDCGPTVHLDAYTGEITEKRYRYWMEKEGKATGQTGYSNVHYTLLSRVLEAVTGKSWQVALKDLVFDPLGLSETTTSATEMFSNGGVYPMVKVGNAFDYARPIKIDSTMHAAGGMGASANDLAKYMIAMLAPDSLARKTMFERRSTRAKSGSIRIREGYGRAWNVGTYRGLTPMVGHGGGYQGAHSMVAMLPEKNMGIAILTSGAAPVGGFEAIPMVDVFDRELGVTNAADLVPGYLTQAEAYYSRPQQQTPNLAFQKQIVPIASLLGRYQNDHWGTITIERMDGLIYVRMGHFRADLLVDGDFYKLVGEAAGSGITPILEKGKAVALDVTLFGTKERFRRS